MKNKYILLLLAVLLAAGLFTACEKQAPAADENKDKISVVTTIFPQYDFVREIAGDNVRLEMLLPPGSESHSYEPTPKDIIAIQNCDMFIYVGGESDEWVNGILSSMDTSKMKLIPLMDLASPVEEEIIEGMQEEEDEEDGHGDEPELDEHVWTSPKNAKLIVSALSKALSEIDADNAGTYQKNTSDYLAKLDELDAQFEDVMDNAARKTIIFADRFPFRYLADAYGLEYYAAFPGCSTETEASASTVAFLIDKVKAEKLPVVFHTEFSNEKMADTIREDTGAKKLTLHACHNISKSDFEGGESYLSLMQGNVQNLKEALS